MSQFYQDSIFWVDVDKIKPNPFQPRKEFDQLQLKSLSDSIRQYGVLQALVVTRKESEKEDGGILVEYELIAGERRLRASKLAGLAQVPVLIKTGDETDLMKLELAIIENLQREDLNPVDRALAFKKLVDEFGFKHITIGEKMGKSREYVTNSLRILGLPEDMLEALKMGKITEGHSRPLLMLTDRPEEQQTLFKEIILRRMTVREAEYVARHIAVDKARLRGEMLDPMTREVEEKLANTLQTRVMIEKKQEGQGGRIMISYFSEEELKNILEIIHKEKASQATQTPKLQTVALVDAVIPGVEGAESPVEIAGDTIDILDDRSKEEVEKADNTESDEELYSIKNFSI
ncbi:MAG: ParB/RepB/Spo0J family partition protein [Candidatus Zambryskibacteria bacterium]|nr:ParB/RepB/Spo0J family partition protein [Candidatus Zambryskibacteria bacterium]